MKLQTVSATSPAVRKQDEKGYTFVEVLIVVAVIAALAIGGFALYTGRGKTTEMTSMAQQIGQTVQSQQQLIFKGLRNGKVTSAEVAGSLNSLLSGHRFVISVASNQNACTTPGATKSGLVFNLNADDFDTVEEAGEVQSIIHAAIINVFADDSGNAYTDKRSFDEVINISAAGGTNTAMAYLNSSAAATYTAGSPATAAANACLDNT